MTRRNRPEEQLHRAIAEWLCWVEPHAEWFHPPNGGARSKAEAGIFKAMGVMAGVPDLVFTLPPHGRTAFVEIKVPGGKLSPAQITFRNRWERAGALWAVACSFNDMAGIFDLWKIKCRRNAGRANPVLG